MARMLRALKNLEARSPRPAGGARSGRRRCEKRCCRPQRRPRKSQAPSSDAEERARSRRRPPGSVRPQRRQLAARPSGFIDADRSSRRRPSYRRLPNTAEAGSNCAGAGAEPGTGGFRAFCPRALAAPATPAVGLAHPARVQRRAPVRRTLSDPTVRGRSAIGRSGSSATRSKRQSKSCVRGPGQR